MKRKQYLGDITSARALLPRESRVIAELLLQKPTSALWNSKIAEENILQKNSSESSIRIANLLRKRVEPLGEKFLQSIVRADDQLLRQLLMVASMIRSPVLEDFMKTVLLDAVRQYQKVLDKGKWLEFYEGRSRNITGLSELTEKTINLTGSNLFTMLSDAGYLDSGRSKKIQTVYLLPETCQWLERLNRSEWIPLMECKV